MPLPRFLVDELARTVVNRPSAAMTLDRYADLFDDDLDDVADRLDALRAASRGRVADFLRTETPSEGSPEPPTEVNPQVSSYEPSVKAHCGPRRFASTVRSGRGWPDSGPGPRMALFVPVGPRISSVVPASL